MFRAAILLALTISACQRDETVSAFVPEGAEYALVTMNGAPFPAAATIGFPEPGQIAGRGPCNGYAAEQTAPYPWLDVGPIRATRAACADLAAERAFFETLSRMTIVEALDDTLILQNDAGEQMVFQSPAR